MSAPCERFEVAALDGRHEEPGIRRHLGGCPDCAEAAERWVRYEAALGAVRRGLDDEEELPPSAWVRIRDRVDRRVERRARWAFWVPVGVALAATAVVLAVQLPDEEATATARTPAVVGQPDPPASVEEQAATPTEPVLAEGQTLSVGPEGRRIAAFGEHVLTLSPGAVAHLERWSPGRIVVRMDAGRIHCDVDREAPVERFEIRTEQATVRVLGTVFSVAVDGAGATRVDVSRGQVAVSEPGGAEHRLVAGQGGRFSGEAEEPDDAQPPPAEAGLHGDGTTTWEPAGATAEPEARPDPAAAEEDRREAREEASESGDEAKVIEIEVPPQRMDPPTPDPEELKPLPGTDEASRERSAHDSEGWSTEPPVERMRIIDVEIDPHEASTEP